MEATPDSTPGLPPLSLRRGQPLPAEEKVRILIRAVEQSPASVLITDKAGLIQYVNPKFTDLMGWTLDEALGQTPRIIKGGLMPEAFYKELWGTILSGREWHGVLQNRTKAGDLVWEVGSISPIRDETGHVTHFVGIQEDITELKRLQGQLEHMAHHDALTGLANRVLFRDRLAQALAAAHRRKSPLAVIYLDLDRFKPVNDTLGHETGDALLAAVAGRLRSAIRASDTVARMGGDEFTVLLVDVQERGYASRVAENLARSLEAPFTLGPHTCTIGASLGIALYPEDGTTVDELLSSADTRMYASKPTRRDE